MYAVRAMCSLCKFRTFTDLPREVDGGHDNGERTQRLPERREASEQERDGAMKVAPPSWSDCVNGRPRLDARAERPGVSSTMLLPSARCAQLVLAGVDRT